MRSKVTSSNLFADFLPHLQNATYFQLKIASCLWKTEVTRRCDWSAWALLGSKIAFVGHYCVQKIVHFCTLFAFWAHFGPSHEVEGHFKQSLCRFSPPSSKCYIFPTKNRFLLMKNGGYSEVRLIGLSLIGFKNRLCGPLLCSKNSTFLYIICILDPFWPIPWGRRSLQAIFADFLPHASIHPLSMHPSIHPFIHPCIHPSMHSFVIYPYGDASIDLCIQICIMDNYRWCAWPYAFRLLCFGWRVGLAPTTPWVNIIIVTASAAPN